MTKSQNFATKTDHLPFSQHFHVRLLTHQFKKKQFQIEKVSFQLFSSYHEFCKTNLFSVPAYAKWHSTMPAYMVVAMKIYDNRHLYVGVQTFDDSKNRASVHWVSFL
jgi:hypothetical protein